jgi:hypothetical protein
MSTRCEGWTVGDVAAHLVGTMAGIAAGRLAATGRVAGPQAVPNIYA